MMTRGRPARPPFDHGEADVILRSSDGEPVDFKFFKLLLSLSSPFFAEIFTLPQPPTPSASAPASPYADEYASFDPVTLKHRRIPVIQMAEDKETLTILLGLCLPPSILYARPPSPKSTPTITTTSDDAEAQVPGYIPSLDHLLKTAEAALKFEMTSLQTHLRLTLLQPRFLESHPLRVFAIAFRYSWDVEARQAARYTLRHPLSLGAMGYVSELEYISAASLVRLQEYHRVCGEVASSRVELQTALVESEDRWAWVTCRRCPGSVGVSLDQDRTQAPALSANGSMSPIASAFLSAFTAVSRINDTLTSGHPDPRRWWVLWIKDVAKELKTRPWGETVRKWDLMNKAIDRAVQTCSFCGPRARHDLEAFAQMLAVEVERDIASVQLDISFDDWSSSASTT